MEASVPLINSLKWFCWKIRFRGDIRMFIKFEKLDSAKCLSARSHLSREYLRENESFSKTILACLSVAQLG